MNRLLRIAVKVQPAQDAAGRVTYHATLPMAVLFEKSIDPEQIELERIGLQEKYRLLVETLRRIRPTLKKRHALDSWLFGDAIVAFEQDTSETLLFVDHLTEHLARDIEYGKAMIDLCRRFRLRLPDQTQIDPTLPFDAYHRSGFDPQRATEFARRAQDNEHK